MNTKKIGAASFAVVAAAGLLAGCGKSTEGDSPVAFSPVTGDQFTANPGAFQTDGIAVPPQGVTMVGNAVAAQAVANSGLPQGTITSTSNNTTVYYPPAPAIPGVRVAPQPAPPAPMVRPANYKPWSYTPQQIEVFQQICETGSYKQTSTYPGGRVSTETQTQTCYTLYGRQLGVKPWTPGQPKPWQRPDYPKPWFSAEFKVDVPVFWVYPKSWTQPKPQPIISVSIGLNLGNNPYRRVNPAYDQPYYPVWAVTPGRVIDVRDQARVVAPIYTTTTSSTTTTTTTTTTAPVFPGTVLAALPTSAKVTPVTALPGAKVAGNVNLDANVTVPTASALKGATIQAGTTASLNDAIGTSVEATVAKPSADNGNRVTVDGKADATVTGGADAKVTGGADATVTGGSGATVSGGAGATVTGGAGAATTTTTKPAQRPTAPAQETTQPTRTQTQEPTQTQTQEPTQEPTQTQPTQAQPTTTTPAATATPQAATRTKTQGATKPATTCTPAQVEAGTCTTGS
ncbi:hypothetical protein [Tsukamurella pulmonis]|uniref:hypothetical protein n=1 Tax=Tsukamurella pulmonis TaxID=47312 RepID=UPI000E098D3A|nr:hypothetical protein [Tsukamurella pulmonis]RDH12619.1 hypothetical protein DVB88_06665 [Tsukamurella pulmonis]